MTNIILQIFEWHQLQEILSKGSQKGAETKLNNYRSCVITIIQIEKHK